MDLELVKKVFDEYITNYDMTDKKINLKYVHSYKVMELMKDLSERLELNDEEIVLAQIIGLLHDIGRFEQVKRYDSFNDRKTCDHGDLGCTYLFDEEHIKDFGIDINSSEARIIEKAIRNHNKVGILEELNDKELLFAKMIRDMDKVDIYRVISVEYERYFDANEVTEEVLKMFSEGKSIPHTITKSKSDGLITELAFVYDIYFNEGFDILAETDNFELYLSIINVDSGSQKLFNKLKEMCIKKINEGV